LWWGALKLSSVVFSSAGITWELSDTHIRTLPSATDNLTKVLKINCFTLGSKDNPAFISLVMAPLTLCAHLCSNWGLRWMKMWVSVDKWWISI